MNAKKKRTIYFIGIIVSVVTLISATIIIFLIGSMKLDLKLTIITIILIVFFFLILYLKNNFDYNDYIYKYAELLKNSVNPVQSTIKINSHDWKKKIISNKFQIFRNYDDFNLYYRIEKLNKTARSKTAIIVISIKNDLKFISPLIDKAINEFEAEFIKKERFKQHIILQFKNVESFNQENIDETEAISFIKPNSNSIIVVINSIYSLKENKNYFIHSNTHNPNFYYKSAVDEIYKLIN